MVRFQCPECGYGDREVGHLVTDAETYCIVCLEMDGRQIRVQCWEEGRQARLRAGLAAGAGAFSAASAAILPPLIGSLSPV